MEKMYKEYSQNHDLDLISFLYTKDLTNRKTNEKVYFWYVLKMGSLQ